MLYRLFYTALVFYLVFVGTTISQAKTEVERGSEAAEKFCARCHVIGENEFGGISSTMSFYMMSEHMDRYEVRLRSVTARRPHIALKLDLTPENIDALIAYIKQLDWRARWKRLKARK